MNTYKCAVQLHPLQTYETEHLPGSSALWEALQAAGVEHIVAVSDLLLWGFFPKPVSLNLLQPDVADPVDPASFKKLRKAKFFSAALLRQSCICGGREAARALCHRISQGKAVSQGAYLYDYTEPAPPRLESLNTRLEKPFIKRLTPAQRFWCFLEVEARDREAVSGLKQLNIGGCGFAVDRFSWFADHGENRLLMAGMRLLPGSRLHENSKSLYRLSADGQYHYITAGAVLDPMDHFCRDDRYAPPFILKY